MRACQLTETNVSQKKKQKSFSLFFYLILWHKLDKKRLTQGKSLIWVIDNPQILSELIRIIKTLLKHNNCSHLSLSSLVFIRFFSGFFLGGRKCAKTLTKSSKLTTSLPQSDSITIRPWLCISWIMFLIKKNVFGGFKKYIFFLNYYFDF